MNDTNSTVLVELSSGIKANFDRLFPSEWDPIAGAYLRIVELSLNGIPLDQVVVNFKCVEQMLKIDFSAEETVPPRNFDALREAADWLQDLAAAQHWKLSPERNLDGISNFIGQKNSEESDPAELTHDLERYPLALEKGDEAHSGNVCTSLDKGMAIEIFKGPAFKSLNSGSQVGRDSDTSSRLKATLSKLRATGSTRPLRFPAQRWREFLSRLESEFPNFIQVLKTVIRPHLSMLEAGQQHRMPPTLLIGPPGVGKTQFAREVQKLLNVPSLFLVIASETNGAALNGSSTFWGNSSPGRLFEQMAWGSDTPAVANPLVIIDEVDKVSARDFDPLSGLYSLLETETAARFEDQSVPGVTLDLSHVRFMLTANDLESIPTPLRSRVQTFLIKPPTEDGMKAIAQRIFESLLDKYNLNFDRVLSEQILDEVIELGPRVSKTRLEAAVAIAVSDDKKMLDFMSWQLTECEETTKKVPIGFM